MQAAKKGGPASYPSPGTDGETELPVGHGRLLQADFREFGDKGSSAGTVDEQLARDVVLLGDLETMVQDVLTWDHTRGTAEGGGGSTVGGQVEWTVGSERCF